MYVKRRFEQIAVEDETLLISTKGRKDLLERISVKATENPIKNLINTSLSMTYFLDTNIIHYLLTEKLAVEQAVYTDLQVFELPNDALISVVSLGEIASFGIRAKWTAKEQLVVDELLQKMIVTDIKAPEIIARYAEIDAFSRNKLAELPKGIKPHKMGKNDLWIAATASVLNATLLTTDQDYLHLNGVYLAVETIPLKKY
jgi:predicted nucleic acid-binding protein